MVKRGATAEERTTRIFSVMLVVGDNLEGKVGELCDHKGGME